MSNNIEASLERFLEHADYEKAVESLYNVTRSAYLAGWLAARASPPSSFHSTPKDAKTNAIKE